MADRLCLPYMPYSFCLHSCPQAFLLSRQSRKSGMIWSTSTTKPSAWRSLYTQNDLSRLLIWVWSKWHRHIIDSFFMQKTFNYVKLLSILMGNEIHHCTNWNNLTTMQSNAHNTIIAYTIITAITLINFPPLNTDTVERAPTYIHMYTKMHACMQWDRVQE